MITGIIFSKDRAMQLEAALRSFFRHAGDADLVRLSVLYLATTPQHNRQYSELAEEYRYQVRFVRESDFRSQVLEIVGAAAPPKPPKTKTPWLSVLRSRIPRDTSLAAAPSHHVLFLVDDCVFVRPFWLRQATEALELNSGAVGFSLRLGRNTTYCYVLDRPQSLPGLDMLPHGIMKWSWVRADGDFGYPLEVSSSIYPAETMWRILQSVGFDDPNTLEAQIFRQKKRLVRHLPNMLSFERSVAFSVPLNRVQSIYKNRAIEALEFSPEALAEMFDRGRRIDTTALDGFVPSACHQEVELQFENKVA